MSNHHKQTKPGDPPCQCPKCILELMRLDGVLPFVSPELFNLPEKKRRRRKKDAA